MIKLNYIAEKPDKEMRLLRLEKVMQMSWTKECIVTDIRHFITYKEMHQNDLWIY
jgi:hypothetical protein